MIVIFLQDLSFAADNSYFGSPATPISNDVYNECWTKTRANQEIEEGKRGMTRGSRRRVAGFPGEGCPDLLFRFRAGIEGLQ
jgi:hypothetical protein